jgi:hypothetical protein
LHNLRIIFSPYFFEKQISAKIFSQIPTQYADVEHWELDAKMPKPTLKQMGRWRREIETHDQKIHQKEGKKEEDEDEYY